MCSQRRVWRIQGIGVSQPSFLGELQRRHVYKVGAAYAVAGWLLAQVITQVLPVFDVSLVAQRILVLVLIAGFPVALVLAWLFDLTPAGIVRTEALPANGETAVALDQRQGIDRRLNLVLGLLLVASLGYLAAEHTVLKSGQAGAAGNAEASERSIAVLPFENLSDDKANAYFASGIQDEILTRLSKIHALKVISRTSTMHFASSPDNLPEIARQLGVSAILEGSVQRAGERVHVNVQLIRAATDEHLWAESYNRTLDDIFGVQAEIAQTVAESLSARLTGDEQTQIASKPTRNTKAYEAYLRGLSMEGRYSASADEFRKRADAYQQAVELDPGFALAWAGLSQARTELYLTYEQTAQQLDLSKQALDEAVRLAPNTAETWYALAFYQYYGLYDFDRAFEAYSTSLKLRPNDGQTIYAMGNVRRRQGRWDEALSLQKRAAELDPLSTQVWFNLGLTLRALHRYDEAEAAFDRGLAAAPGDPVLLAQKLRTLEIRGDFTAASAIAEQLPLDSDDDDVLAGRIVQWQYQRDYPRAIREIKQILQRREQLSDLSVALQLGALGGLELLHGERPAGLAHLAESQRVVAKLQAKGNTSARLDVIQAENLALIGDRAASYRSADIAAEKLATDHLILPQARYAQAFTRMLGGDKAGAVGFLADALGMPNGYGESAATLRQDPAWDPLHGDPAFEKLTHDLMPAKTS